MSILASKHLPLFRHLLIMCGVFFLTGAASTRANAAYAHVDYFDVTTFSYTQGWYTLYGDKCDWEISLSWDAPSNRQGNHTISWNTSSGGNQLYAQLYYATPVHYVDSRSYTPSVTGGFYRCYVEVYAPYGGDIFYEDHWDEPR